MRMLAYGVIGGGNDHVLRILLASLQIDYRVACELAGIKFYNVLSLVFLVYAKRVINICWPADVKVL